jgi:hypothetical protein
VTTACGIHPDHDPVCLLLHLPKLDPSPVVESGGQRYFELGKPLLSLFRPCDTRPAQAMSEPHGTRQVSVGSRNESDGPGAWTEPRQTPILRSTKQVAAVCSLVPNSGRWLSA